jgi:hypothetical protein
MGRLSLSWFGFAVLCLVIVSTWPGDVKGDPEGTAMDDLTANRIKDIRSFPLDYDSGTMALHALQSAISAYGFSVSYQQVAGLSGAIFKFVYDGSESYEPLRDVYPVDVLTTASKSLGFSKARWEIGQPIDKVKDLIKEEIDGGRPVLVPFITNEPYHGFFIIAGYDFDKNMVYLRGARQGTKDYAEVPIPDEWDGPTVSPAGWATNPIFIIGPNTGGGIKRLRAEKRTLELGISLMRGGALPYGSHPGEQRYTAGGVGRQATYGLPAYDLLSSDVENEPFVIEIDGEKTFNFGFIWRIDAQMGQLQHDRHQGGLFLRNLSGGVPSDRAEDVNEIVLGFQSISEDARDFRRFFWNEIPTTLTDAQGIVDYVGHSSSMVFRIWGPHKLRHDIEAMGFGMYDTPWGWVLVDDSHEKRMLAKTALRRVYVRDRRLLSMLEDIVEHIDWGRPGTRGEPKGSRRDD